MISVTPNEFDELLHHLTPIVDLTCNNNICTSPNKCEKLWVYMATFSIQLKMVIYTIPASGLTIDTADGCLIGVTSSGDNSETVLGTLFMKSYGTILDFDKNKVTFALTGEATARQKLAWPIIGWTSLVVVLLVTLAVVVTYLCKKKTAEVSPDDYYKES